MSTVLDASAILAFLGDEQGAGLVEEALEDEALCGAANWSEVAQKIGAAGRDCLALAERVDADARTADAAWRSTGRVRQIR